MSVRSTKLIDAKDAICLMIGYTASYCFLRPTESASLKSKWDRLGFPINATGCKIATNSSPFAFARKEACSHVFTNDKAIDFDFLGLKSQSYPV